MSEERFKVVKTTNISSLIEGEVKELPTSDLCIQTDHHLIQFKLEEVERERKKFKIKPGIFNIVETNSGVILDKFELKQPSLLETVNNTKNIMEEVEFFFNRLNIYEELKLDKKRALLLHGVPGTGKTASITKVCNNLIKEDKGTVIINWNSACVSSSAVLDFFSSGSEFVKEATRLVLLIEDIGTDSEAHYGARAVDRSLLNLLDGVGINFKVPTFIIATTNYVQKLPENLADRPGRFDKVIQINLPSDDERVQLLKFIAKRELTENEIREVKDKQCKNFSIAHLKEIVVRSKLDEKSIGQVIKELIAHSKKFQKGFEEGGNMGL